MTNTKWLQLSPVPDECRLSCNMNIIFSDQQQWWPENNGNFGL